MVHITIQDNKNLNPNTRYSNTASLSSDLTHFSLSVERDKQVFVKFCGEFWQTMSKCQRSKNQTEAVSELIPGLYHCSAWQHLVKSWITEYRMEC